jgi:hypothetical protein
MVSIRESLPHFRAIFSVHPANEYLQYFSREDAFFDVEEREEREGGEEG